jgi:hypothetical protein
MIVIGGSYAYDFKFAPEAVSSANSVNSLSSHSIQSCC